jgi:exonuclease SbcC
MSHARTVIEPAEGLTVLVGPNNCGKSAVVTALQILCQNDNSTYVTRHNERECRVTIETDDGHVIEWCRKNNSPRYTIDGQLFDRLGRNAIPEGLHDVLRLPKVAVEGNQEFDVHFGEQKSPVFLLDKPGAHAAQFFASSSDAASLVEMQKRHQQKLADARRERAQLEGRAEKLGNELAALAGTDQIEAGVGQLEAEHQELGRLDFQIEELSWELETLEQAMALRDRHESEATALAALTLPPVLERPQSLEDLIDALARTQQDAERQAARAISLGSLQNPPETMDDRPLVELIDQLLAAQASCLRLDGECVATRELVPPPITIDVQGLRTMVTEIASLWREVKASDGLLAALLPLATAPELCDEAALAQDVLGLARAAAALQRIDAVHAHLEALAAVPELADTREMEAAIRELAAAAAALASRNREVEEAEAALRESEQELRAWAEQQQLCPTCGGALDPTQVVVHAGSCAGGPVHV